MDILSLRNAIDDRIETARLILRAPDRRDVVALARLANNAKIHAMLARLPHPYTQADAIAFVDEFSRQDSEKVYAITQKSGAFIGVVGLTFAKDAPPALGYWLGEPYWGKGYATEAVGALVAAAVATGRCPAILARARSDNPSSRNVLSKLGFVETGEAIDDCGPHKGLPIVSLRLGHQEQSHARSA